MSKSNIHKFVEKDLESIKVYEDHHGPNYSDPYSKRERALLEAVRDMDRIVEGDEMLLNHSLRLWREKYNAKFGELMDG